MTPSGIIGLATGATLMLGAAAHAAPPGPPDPDWPCQQIKVPELSLAAVWAGPPVDPQKTDWQQHPTVANLVHDLAQRRVPPAEAEDRIAAFARQAQQQKQPQLLMLLSGLFDVLDAERSSVIAGLDRFGARQKELAAGIRDDNDKLHTMQADTDVDAGQSTRWCSA